MTIVERDDAFRALVEIVGHRPRVVVLRCTIASRTSRAPSPISYSRPKPPTPFTSESSIFAGESSPPSIATAGHVNLRGVGLSNAKAAAMLELARARSTDARLAQHGRMSDQRRPDDVVAVRGIGPWTAQMYLMHTSAPRRVARRRPRRAKRMDARARTRRDGEREGPPTSRRRIRRRALGRRVVLLAGRTPLARTVISHAMPLISLDDFERDALPTLDGFGDHPFALARCSTPSGREDGYLDRRRRRCSRTGRASANLNSVDIEIHRLEGRTPMLVVTVDSTAGDRAPSFSTATSTSSRRSATGRRASTPTSRCDGAIVSTRAASPTTATPVFSASRAIEAMEAQRHSSRALRRPHRSERGERQQGPRGVPRRSGRAPGRRRATDLPRLGRSHLRPPLGHDVASRRGQP